MTTLAELIEREDIGFYCSRHALELDPGERTCPYCKESEGDDGAFASKPTPPWTPPQPTMRMVEGPYRFEWSERDRQQFALGVARGMAHVLGEQP